MEKHLDQRLIERCHLWFMKGVGFAHVTVERCQYWSKMAKMVRIWLEFARSLCLHVDIFVYL